MYDYDADYDLYDDGLYGDVDLDPAAREFWAEADYEDDFDLDTDEYDDFDDEDDYEEEA
jgi:hypothetical protein